MQIPLPFSRVHLRFEGAVEVPADLDADGAEALRLELERELAEGQARLDRDTGDPGPLIS